METETESEQITANTKELDILIDQWHVLFNRFIVCKQTDMMHLLLKTNADTNKPKHAYPFPVDGKDVWKVLRQKF